MQEIMDKTGVRKERVQFTFQVDLEKDLLENEVICPECKGSGMTVTQFNFGLRNAEVLGQPFPFKKQSLSFCQHCCNGVQRKCEFCGNLMARDLYCSCAESQREYRNKAYKEEKARWEEAKKITFEQAVKDYEYLYIYTSKEENFVTPDELEEYLAELKKDDPELKVLIYATKSTYLVMNAKDTVESHADDLHEEAMELISDEKYEELQGFMDKWCEEVKDETLSYYPDYSIGVVI
ncbi:hypothetical protein [Aneurinibacillus thermoaerophilus]|jgi:hypothetical protein|uniref:hypothetical protein n=1 Tax=Aneurinibacillus thermoaerophilus TaxID=143495 RepID=UPI002E20AD2C|nr:hypothetical protein [Aneurinibacillus thermoaerophilus]